MAFDTDAQETAAAPAQAAPEGYGSSEGGQRCCIERAERGRYCAGWRVVRRRMLRGVLYVV